MAEEELDFFMDDEPFLEEHFVSRVSKLKEKCHSLGIEAFIISDPKSIYYFGSSCKPLERPFFIVVFPDNIGRETTIIVPKLEEEHIVRRGKLPSVVVSYWDFPSENGSRWIDKLKNVLEGLTSIGIEPSLTIENFKVMKENLHESTTIEVYETILDLRMVKSEKEISMIRKTSRYTDKGMKNMLDNSYYGISALEVFIGQKSFESNVKLQEIPTKQFDPLQLEFLNFIFPAPHSSEPHGVPPLNSRLEKGPHIAISYLKINGYAAECERTVFFTQPSDKEKEIFQDMLEARMRALDLVRPGAHCGDIDRASMDFLKEKGYGKYLLHRTGHGIGHDNHEGPWIAEGCDHVLEEGMVISIEPGIYVPEIGGFRHSDTVLIVKDGYELLTHYPIELEELIVKSNFFAKTVKGPFLKWYLRISEMDKNMKNEL